MPETESDRATIRVLLVDDHPVVRRGLASLLSTLAGVEVVAQAGTGEEALREVALSRPHVAVMDLRMPGMDGVETTRRIVRDYPETAVLVLTMFDDDIQVAEVLRAEARGYLVKWGRAGRDRTCSAGHCQRRRDLRQHGCRSSS